MAHRMQITLRDDQYERLRLEAAKTGLSIAELIRRSLERRYGRLSTEEKLQALEESFGAWHEAPGEDRAEYLARLRGPGLGHRIATEEGLDQAS